ncbi:MAG TPA: hypothetical protein PKD85_05015 [Saprospiraceae bacterium]|nr:hypothetical protein [Saprospiraceae bacterium]
MNNQINLRWVVLCLIIALAAATRLIPHMLNFSPLGAIALFGAAHFKNKIQAILIPVAATWLSDLFINNVIYAQYYPTLTWFYEGFYWQYGSYLLIGLAGMQIFKKVSVPRILAGALSASFIFFIVSNFGCWVGSTFYSQDFLGLGMCYAAGIPFLKGTLLGDMVYTTVLFGGFVLIERKYLVAQRA